MNVLITKALERERTSNGVTMPEERDELTIKMRWSNEHPSPMSEDQKLVARVGAPSVADLFKAKMDEMNGKVKENWKYLN